MGPWILGGDFNVTFFADDRWGGDKNHRDQEDFNDTISQVKLIDLPINDWLFNWSNMRENSHLAEIDRILVSNIWDSKFPWVEVFSVQRPISDHTPICLNSREGTLYAHRCFHFKKWWLEHKEVHDIIKES